MCVLGTEHSANPKAANEMKYLTCLLDCVYILKTGLYVGECINKPSCVLPSFVLTLCLIFNCFCCE